MRSSSSNRRVVLLGAGHAHVQVLRSLAMEPEPATEVILVTDRARAVYSGMVPAWVAGERPRAALEIDALPLGTRANARVILSPVLKIDAVHRTVEIEGRPPIAWDVCSVNIGATVAGLELPGVRTHALASRPISRLLDRLDAAVERLVAGRATRVPVVVAGDGAAGVELAFTLDVRLREAGLEPTVTLVGLRKTLTPRLQNALLQHAEGRGIGWTKGRVREVRPRSVVLDTGETLPSHLTLWATGAAPHPLGRESGLPVNERGFLRVADTLEVPGIPGLFGAGDAVQIDGHTLPRAGVYAVRQGPTLTQNIRAAIRGAALTSYKPQADVLALLNLGDGQAIAHKWGMPVQGAWARRVKASIDTAFMERFQVLEGEGQPRHMSVAAMMTEMADARCGGCAAKVDRRSLQQTLQQAIPAARGAVQLGADAGDDVAVVRIRSTDVAVSVDGFVSPTPDPFVAGQLAARNAVGDLFAKGLHPTSALPWVTVPETPWAAEDLAHVLAGMRTVLDPVGCPIVGGHSTVGDELALGVTVLSDVPQAPWALHSGRPGDVLVLSGPIGTGVFWRAHMMGLVSGDLYEASMHAALRPLPPMVTEARMVGVQCGTDITGFGLLTHVGELALASRCTAELVAERIPVLAGVRTLIEQGIRSTGEQGNLQGAPLHRIDASVGPVARALLHDPQTAGPVLWCVPPDEVAHLLSRVPHAVPVGVLKDRVGELAVEVVP
ncbi:MAG: selenide, water dikinase SelD [Myxococcota bacterium]